jgi:hypothetical protein
MGELIAHPRAPDAENLIRRGDDNARETENLLAVVSNHDTRAAPLE